MAEYGREIWEQGNADEIESVHKIFCKFGLGVSNSTTNLACYEELGREPLVLGRKF